MEHAVKIFSLIAAGFSYIFGGWSFFLTFLFLLNAADFFFGILASDEPTSSNRLYKGGIKKGIMWFYVGVSNGIYLLLKYLGFDVGIVIPNYVACYYILMELVSIEESTEKLGLPMPTPIKFFVAKLRTLIDDKFKTEKEDGLK